jgi:hypothetical protein
MPHAAPDNPLYRRFLEGRPDRPQIHKWHHYFDVYHAAFAPWRGKAPTMLEIGVQRGGSLAMWQEYFGDGARIFGMDVDPAVQGNAPPGTKVFIGDQADPPTLKRILDEIGPPDIVLDDGGHTMRQMITSFQVLYPAMKLPGVYLIEDTHTAFWGEKTGLARAIPGRRSRFHDDPKGNTIYDLAFAVVRELQAWTGRANAFPRYGTPPETRPPAEGVSEICRTTESVSFHDSIIVFRRAAREEPWHDVR